MTKINSVINNIAWRSFFLISQNIIKPYGGTYAKAAVHGSKAIFLGQKSN